MKYKVVKYGTPWCGPCVMMDTIMESAAKEFPDVEFENVDVSEDDCAINEFRIVAIPTIICFKEDKVVSKTTGPMTYPVFKTLIENLLTA